MKFSYLALLLPFPYLNGAQGYFLCSTKRRAATQTEIKPKRLKCSFKVAFSNQTLTLIRAFLSCLTLIMIAMISVHFQQHLRHMPSQLTAPGRRQGTTRNPQVVSQKFFTGLRGFEMKCRAKSVLFKLAPAESRSQQPFCATPFAMYVHVQRGKTLEFSRQI